MKLKMVVEYLGEGYSGWQRQTGLRTIQSELEEALQTYLRSQRKKLGLAPPDPGSDFRDGPELVGSGRTDSGVNALGQVVSFLWPEDLPLDCFRVRGALNGILPEGIVVRELTAVAEDFDARHSPHVKSYRYQIILRGGGDAFTARSAWKVSADLDIPAMICAARSLVGSHDFSSFRSADCMAKSTVRTLELSELSRISADELVYVAHGKGFLKQMIRIIVGTLVEIGRGRRPASDMERLLRIGDRSQAGETAPARGLVMEWVRYL